MYTTQLPVHTVQWVPVQGTGELTVNLTTPPQSKKYKRPRKHSSGVSPNNSSQSLNVSMNTNQNANSSFTIDMNEIFQTVLSNVSKDKPASNEDIKQPHGVSRYGSNI